MLYVKVKQGTTSTVEQYPYTLTDLVRDNPQVSFPSVITDEIAAEFNVFPVVPAEQPPESHDTNQKRTAEHLEGVWAEAWIVTPASPEEIAERTSIKEHEVRKERDVKLYGCDWTQLSDVSVDKPRWGAYRQQLRDLTNQPGFPWNVVWPVSPEVAP